MPLQVSYPCKHYSCPCMCHTLLGFMPLLGVSNTHRIKPKLMVLNCVYRTLGSGSELPQTEAGSDHVSSRRGPYSARQEGSHPEGAQRSTGREAEDQGAVRGALQTRIPGLWWFGDIGFGVCTCNWIWGYLVWCSQIWGYLIQCWNLGELTFGIFNV